MKRILPILLVLCVAICAAVIVVKSSGRSILTSPDGEFKFSFEQSEDGALLYSVSFKGEEVISQGEMGLNIDGMGSMSDLKLLDTKRTSVDQSWRPPYAERAEIVDHYKEMTLEMSSESGELFTIEVRAYNEGVAFRYYLPEVKQPITIESEITDFTPAKGSKAYYTHRAQAIYTLRELSGWGNDEISERPLTMELPSGLFAAICEANMVTYARGKLKLHPSKEATIALSMASSVRVDAPYKTPWRVIMAAERAVDLINNNDITLNLSDECKIDDTSWIRPGKVYRTGLMQQEVIDAIDFSAARNYQYVHLDAGWYGAEFRGESDAATEDKDLDIEALCTYAKSKGLGVILYVNQRALANQLDEILPLYQSWGVSGIKFGFVNVGDQKWTLWLHDAVRKCAEYGIVVNIHDEYRPTGFSRTYPNLLSQEGIYGNEEMPDADHNTTLPFTRMLCGAADYTFCYYSSRVKNSKAHQLALPVIYYSPLQYLHWYDRINQYSDEAEMAFWSAIPTVWDDSRAIEGEIGEYIVQARRSGDEWFVGAITSTSAREVAIKTSEFLERGKSYSVAIYEDDPSLKTKSKVRTSQRDIKGGDELSFKLLASGGVALHFTEI